MKQRLYQILFQLTHLLRGATEAQMQRIKYQLISTHAPLARCDGFPLDVRQPRKISTHAPLARCDNLAARMKAGIYISTHAPLARCDRTLGQLKYASRISTHAPLARCDACWWTISDVREISTHAPLARCDVMLLYRGVSRYFNSRTSCEVRRCPLCCCLVCIRISTHAPLARCDISPQRFQGRAEFQLTHLLRGATVFDDNGRLDTAFQLTHLLRGATWNPTTLISRSWISTHAPLARCDGYQAEHWTDVFHFNSRTSFAPICSTDFFQLFPR